MNFINSLVTKPEIEIEIDEIQPRKKYIYKQKLKNKLTSKTELIETSVPVFYDRESIIGKVNINIKSLQKYEHEGIKIDLIGQIEDKKAKKTIKFITISKELEPSSILSNENSSFSFKFQNVQKQYETYIGSNMNVRYILQASVNTKTRKHSQDFEFAVFNPILKKISEFDFVPLRMDVGIDDWLHLVFESKRNVFHLKDVIKGSVRFKTCSLKLVSMEIQILRKEVSFGNDEKTETTVVSRHQIMDGAPSRNEIIPLKIFLTGIPLTPSFDDVNSRLQVVYYLNLVLIDVEERRFFKQCKIVLVRVDEKLIRRGGEDEDEGEGEDEECGN